MSQSIDVIEDLIFSKQNLIYKNTESLYKTKLTFSNPKILDYGVEGDISPLPNGREGFVFWIYNDNYYIFGGKSPSNIYFNDCFKFNLERKTWSPVSNSGDIPSPRAFSTFSTFSNFLIIHGGRNNTNTQFNTVYVFNMEIETWILLNTFGTRPSARDKHMSFIHNNNFYILGGRNLNIFSGRVSDLRDIWRLNLSTFFWTNLANMPNRVIDSKLGKIGNRIYCFYGHRQNDNARNEIYRADILINNNLSVFTRIFPNGIQPQSRTNLAIAVDGNLIYLMGGKSDNSTLIENNEFAIFNTSTSTFTLTSSFLSTENIRSNASLFLHNNIFYFFGGVTSSQSFNDIWSITPVLQKIQTYAFIPRVVNSTEFFINGYKISVKNIQGIVFICFYTKKKSKIRLTSLRISN